MINFILIIALGTTVATPTIVHRKTRQTQGNRSIGFAAVIDFTNFQIQKEIDGHRFPFLISAVYLYISPTHIEIYVPRMYSIKKSIDKGDSESKEIKAIF